MSDLAQKWREAAAKSAAASAVTLTLPSGATVLARRPDIQLWLLRGRLPAAITAAFAAVRDAATPAELTTEQIAELGRFYYDVVVATVIDPRIVRDEPAAGEISYREISDADVEFIVGWATRQEEAAAAGTFRDGGEHAAPGGHGAGVRSAAKRARGNRGSGSGD